MEHTFVINPTASRLDIFDTFNRKLEQAQIVADTFGILGEDLSPQLLTNAFALISDLIDDMKMLCDSLYKHHETI